MDYRSNAAEALTEAVRSAAFSLEDSNLPLLLEAIPAAAYVTDKEGRLTHFNRAAVGFSGRVPRLGSDQWCVSWKLYDAEGRPMRHDECPMAVALREGRPIRGAEAIAERPDGKRLRFLAHPTPFFDDAGNVVGGINILVDLTERRQFETALRESEERYRSLVSLMPAAIYTCGAPSGVISFYNARAVELWGRAPRVGDTDERFCGSFRLCRPDGSPLPHAETPMAVAIQEGRSFRNEDVVIERPDGSRISVLVNIDPIRDEAGAVVGAINVFVDTTALKEAEKELLRRSKQLSAFLETAAIGLHRVGADGTILWANDAELRMLGYARDEYIGHNIAEFHADRPVIEKILGCLSRGERLYEYEARLRCKDGSIKEALIDSSVYWEEGRFLHTQCFTRDITQKKKVDELHSRLAAIVDSSLDSIVSMTLEGVITSWNRGAERLYGYSEDEAVGKHISLIIPPECSGEGRTVLDRIRRNERLEHFETERLAKDGRRIAVSLTVSPMRSADGRIIGASKVARDITERKRAEQERLDADRRKDEFLATLSHELRNPLAPIRSSIELLVKLGGDAKVREHAVAILDRQARQMTRMVDELMELTRISRGAISLDKQQVDLVGIVAGAVETSRPLIEGGDHRLEVSVPEGPLHVMGDSLRIAQIMANLLNNAAKYTPRGGHIWLRVAPTERDATITVGDSGVGIEADKLPKIFDMFTQVNPSSLAGRSGLGIGLAIARGLAHLHGGDIRAYSAGPGQGSEFTVVLPRGSLRPQPTQEQAGAAIVPRLEGVSVVVADDNVDAAQTMAILLGEMGCDVRVVHTGWAAVQAVRESDPNVLLLDLSLPDIEGYAVADVLKKDARSSKVRIVALTGHGLEQYRQRSNKAGFDGHLVKPVEVSVLGAMLHRLISNHG